VPSALLAPFSGATSQRRQNQCHITFCPSQSPFALLGLHSSPIVLEPLAFWLVLSHSAALCRVSLACIRPCDDAHSAHYQALLALND